MLSAALWLQAKTFDLRFDAASVEKVVAVLGRESGEALSVDAKVAREIVAVDLSRTTSQAAKSRLAECLDAEWTAEGRLVRSSARLSKERKSWDALRLEAFRRALAKKPLPAFDARTYAREIPPMLAMWNQEERSKWSDAEIRAAAEAYRENSPTARLGARLAAELTPEAVASIDEGHLVFNTAPKASQRAATPDQIAALRTYLRESEELADTGIDLPRMVGGAPASPSNLEVVFDGRPGYVGVRYRLLDTTGRPVSGGFGDSIEADYRLASKIDVRPDERPLDPGPIWGFTNDGDHPVPARIRDGLLDVEKNDPLAPVGAWLARCAAARGEGLVAVLGDDLLDAIPNQAIRPGAFLDSLSKRAYSVHESDGLLQIVPLDRASVRTNQASRAALASWLDVERTGSRLSMDDFFRLSPRLPLAGDSPALAMWLGRLDVANPYWNTPLVRLAARLPVGRTMRLGSLAPEVGDELRRRIVRSGPGDYRVRSMFFCGTGMDVADDPTDELPNGISLNATLRLEETRTPAFVEVYPDGSLWPYQQCWTVDEIDDSIRPTCDRVRVGACHRIDLTVDLGHGQTFQERIEAVERLGPTIASATLPEPLLSAVRRRNDRLAKDTGPR